MLEFVNKYGYNITSQNGENGIINECLFRIKPEFKVAVEFGAPDREYCSNIFPLEKLGWKLYYYSDEASNGVEKKFITPENVNELQECSILSIDIDGNDYAVWKAYEGKPDIVIIEINSSLNPYTYHFNPETGASFLSMLDLGVSKGYFLLCHTGNLIFIDNAYKYLFPEIEPVTIEKYFNKSWLC